MTLVISDCDCHHWLSLGTQVALNSVFNLNTMKASVIVQSWPKEPRGFASFKNHLRHSLLRCYASVVLFDYGYCDFNEFEQLLKRTCAILETINLSIQAHIRSIFWREDYQIRDRKFSALAVHLLKINGNPKNECVATYHLKTLYFLNQDINPSL